MKNLRKALLSMVLILVAAISVFAGCEIKLAGGPNAQDAVTSNGGMVVQKGDYLYFTNGYISATGANNKYGEVEHSAVYRAKLENNKLSYDEEGNLKDVELLVPRITGYEKTGLFIYGEHLYYATPNTEKNKKDGEVDTKLIDFYRVNLNGKNNTRLYKSTVSSENTQFSFNEINGKVFLTVFDTEKVVVINCGNKSAKVIAEGVSSAVLPKVTENNPLNNTISEIESRVYYTRSAKEDENNTGNVMAYASIESGEEVVVNGLNPSATYSLKELNYNGAENTYVLYTSNESGLELYYCAKFVNNEINMQSQEKLTTKAQTNKVYLFTDPTTNNAHNGVVTTNANGVLIVITLESEYKEEVVAYNELGKITILDVNGINVFCYNSDNQLFVVNLKDLSKTATQLTTKDETYDFSMNVNFDVNGEYVYLFKTFEGDAEEGETAEKGAYLIRIKYMQTEDYADEFLGDMLEKHIKTEEAESEE